ARWRHLGGCAVAGEIGDDDEPLETDELRRRTVRERVGRHEVVPSRGEEEIHAGILRLDLARARPGEKLRGALDRDGMDAAADERVERAGSPEDREDHGANLLAFSGQ